MRVTYLTSGLLVRFSYRRKLRTLYFLTLTQFHSNVITHFYFYFLVDVFFVVVVFYSFCYFITQQSIGDLGQGVSLHYHALFQNKLLNKCGGDIFKFQFYVTCFSKEVGYLGEGINNILTSTKTRQNLVRAGVLILTKLDLQKIHSHVFNLVYVLYQHS